MIGTLLATVRKELLLLARDRAGLAILFAMPLALVFVITLVQDAPLRQFQEVKLSLLLTDADGGAIGELVARHLTASGAFAVTRLDTPAPDPEAAVRRVIEAGEHQVGVIIPHGASAAFEQSVTAIASSAMRMPGFPPAQGDLPPAAEILIVVDPALSRQSRSAVMNALRSLATSIEKQALAALVAGRADAPPDLLVPRLVAGEGTATAIPNAVQQNVPAWTMFAMFFTVVPLAGTLIREKNDMIALRLLSMPSAFITRVMGKVVVYFVVCLSQFLLMVAMGMHLLPLFGVPRLTIGAAGWAPVALIAAAAALAATGYGILVGTVATSHEQASSFGAVSIVIAAVVGGVMVPTFAMPAPMQRLSGFSPLNWGLSGFLDVFLRGATVAGVAPAAGRLLLFAAGTMVASWLWFRMRGRE